MTIEKNAQAFSESQNEREQLLENYSQQMEVYQRLTREVRALERRYPLGAREQAMNYEITAVDKDRHQNHLSLIAIAEKLGKSKADVLVDIIRWENSLREYGLPEFSILKSSDIINTQEIHSAIQFNIDNKTGKPGSPNPLDKTFGEYEFGKKFYYGGETKRVFFEDEILLVFLINPMEGYKEDEIKPWDFKEREERAKALTKEIHGKYFDNYQGGYHETSAHIIGVVFFIEDLERVASVIRDNPQKFRLGEEFYNK